MFSESEIFSTSIMIISSFHPSDESLQATNDASYSFQVILKWKKIICHLNAATNSKLKIIIMKRDFEI